MHKKITVLPGDGIGPEIIEQAVRALNTVASKYGHTFDYTYALVGAAAIDACGDPYPSDTHALCQSADAILFGAIGDPKFDNDPTAKVRPEQGLLRMRKSLGLFANLRPIQVMPALADASPLKKEKIEGVDFIVVRELTGGIYFGEKGRNDQNDEAFDMCRYSRMEIERVLRMAFELAVGRKNKLTVVDKANVLETSRLWRECAQQLHAAEFPQVEMEFLFVDNAAMQMITRPSAFDVIVTENMFGDILTDEASVITGSLGLLPSASLGSAVGLYEPIHGSYPQAAGKNIANPLATILSAAMLLETSFGMKAEATCIREACEKTISEGIVTEDIAKGKSFSTTQVGDAVCRYILA